MKVYIRHKTIVYFIQFKNVKIALDEESCVFLGSIKNNEAKINKNPKYAAVVSILSARGSKNLPKSVTRLYFLAISVKFI